MLAQYRPGARQKQTDNDPYVSLNQAQFVADNCQAEIVVIKGQGHFNLEHSDAYQRFPRLLEIMEQKEFIVPSK